MTNPITDIFLSAKNALPKTNRKLKTQKHNKIFFDLNLLSNMKSLSEIINQEPVFLHDWAKDKTFQLICNFFDISLVLEEYEAQECPYAHKHLWLERKNDIEEKLKEFEKIKILFASYTYQNYEGNAFVLFEQDGELYEVNGSHCSCFGLETQWNP